jgi:hypothetical protein
LIEGTYNLLRDMAKVTFDGIYWLWHRLWLTNRGIIRQIMPGQSRYTHSVVVAVAVILEIIGLWLVTTHWASTH